MERPPVKAGGVSVCGILLTNMSMCVIMLA